MRAITNSKKWSIIALASVVLVSVAYFASTGQISGLGSSALTTTNVCTEKSQAKKLAEYNNAIKNRDRTQSRVAIAYEQINVLEKRIDAQKLIIQQKEETISQQTKTITELDGYIKKNCTNPKTTQQKNLCTQKKQQKNSLTQNNLAQKSAIKTATSSIRQLEGQIESKKSEITNLNQKIDAYTAILLSYESCEAELGVKFYPACSLLFHTLGVDINTPCENESGKMFQGYPFGQAGAEYRFILKGSEVKNVSVQSLTFFLGGTDEQKTKFTNIRLSTGIETNDVIAQCERVADSIHCPLSSPITLKKQDIAYWYLNANVDIAEDHSFTLDVGGVNVGGKYDTKNKNQNTKFAITAYAKSPLTGEPGNFNVWETKKDHTIKLGSGSQTLYEFQVKAENGEVAMTDVVLSSEFLEGGGKIPEDFISCADPRLRNQLFDGMLELYDGTKLIATSEDYSQTYTKFDIKTPILIKQNTEKKFTIKANMQSSGLGTQCSFSVTPNILANSGSFSTHELNYITNIKGTDSSQFRFSSWTCYNGEKQEQGGSSSCKSTDTWRKYAEDFCAQKCSPETGKCGVNSFSNSEPCGQTTTCGNSIVETGETCDDGNTKNGDGCSNQCIKESFVQVMSPNGGETFTIGQEVLIKWDSSTDVERVMVGYSTCESCLDWVTNEGPIQNTGSLNWKIRTGSPGPNFKIRIFGYSNISPSVEDISDSAFTVKDNISSPVCGNGTVENGEQCDDGNTYNYDWCSNSCVDIADAYFSSPETRLSFSPFRSPIQKIVTPGELSVLGEWTVSAKNGSAKIPYLRFQGMGIGHDTSCDIFGEYEIQDASNKVLATGKLAPESEVGNAMALRFDFSGMLQIDSTPKKIKIVGKGMPKNLQNISNKVCIFEMLPKDLTRERIEREGDNTGFGPYSYKFEIKKVDTCSSIQGSTACLKQDGCYYNEKTSKCTAEVLKCEDVSDAQDDIFTKGMIWGFARHVYSPRYYQASYDYCTGNTINQVSCDSEGFAKYTTVACPNGCSDGACKKVDLKPDISIDITDANSYDIDKVTGDDTQTILSGGIASFKVRISNIGTEDVKNISVADNLVPGCNGTINLPNMYPTVWSNFTVGGNGNHSDSNLQPGEFIEFTCSQPNTVGSFTNSITSNAQGVTSSVVVTKNDSTAVVVKIPQPSELSVYPQLESAFSTPSSIIPVGTTGVANGSKSTFLFQTDTGDAIDIHEVSFTIQGANTIKALKWEGKNITVPVINNTALFFIPESQSRIDSGSHLVFTVEYNGVGNLGVPYASTSKLTLNSVKYTDATGSTKRKAYSAATDVVTLVGSVPHIFIDPIPSNTLMNGTINLGKMKIVAHPTGDVSPRTFAVVITKPSNISLTNFELHGPTGIIPTETSTITNLPTKKIVEFVVTNPYTINAGSMSIFDIRASVSGAMSDQKIVWYLSSDFTWIDNTFGIDKIGANAGLFTGNLIDFPQNIIELSN